MMRNIKAGAAAIILCVAVAISSGCTKMEVVKKEVIDKTYTPGHVETYTTTSYRYSFAGNGGFVPVPQMQSKWVDDKYSVTVRVQYGDGTGYTTHYDVTEQEWNRVQIGDDLLAGETEQNEKGDEQDDHDGGRDQAGLPAGQG